MPKPARAYPEKLALYEKLAATNPKTELKGATVPYASLNGYIFSKDAKPASPSIW